MRLISFGILALLALLYIAQASQGTTKRVEVRSLQNRADHISSQVDQLQLEAIRLQSLETISQNASTLNLEPIQSVEYIR